MELLRRIADSCTAAGNLLMIGMIIHMEFIGPLQGLFDITPWVVILMFAAALMARREHIKLLENGE